MTEDQVITPNPRSCVYCASQRVRVESDEPNRRTFRCEGCGRSWAWTVLPPQAPTVREQTTPDLVDRLAELAHEDPEAVERAMSRAQGKKA